MTTGHRYRSEFARRHFSQGHAKGMAEGMAEAVLMVLDTRGIEISAGVRARIAGVRDNELLDEWIRRAVVADKIEDVDSGFRTPR